MSASEAGSVLAARLCEYAARVRTLEKTAAEALYTEKNEAAYRKLMNEKAALLSTLAADVGPLLEALPEALRERTAETLTAFSENAATALRIGSVFYMSALLYPDEHKEGEPNTLEVFIASLPD